jgi:hypothetical protein
MTRLLYLFIGQVEHCLRHFVLACQWWRREVLLEGRLEVPVAADLVGLALLVKVALKVQVEQEQVQAREPEEWQVARVQEVCFKQEQVLVPALAQGHFLLLVMPMVQGCFHPSVVNYLVHFHLAVVN